MGRVWVLLALVGCLRSGAVSCPDGRVCPVGLACAVVNDVPYCVEEGQIGCGAESEACGEAGTCHSDVCLPNECGNALVDVGEVCDLGDSLPGAGCSATCTSTEICGNDIIDPVAGEQCDNGIAGLSNDGCTSTCGIEVLGWDDISPRPIDPRTRAAVAYDSERDITLLFGGVGQNQIFGDTWEWNGVRWKRRITGGAPPARSQFPMVYDVTRDRFVMFGGVGLDFLGDTWEFDGTSWVQRVTTSAPSPRGSAVMAYHAARNETLLFGGYDADSTFDDTWVWNGTTWTQQPTPSALVPQRTGVMTYDATRSEIVYYNNWATWTWNGSWTQRPPTTTPTTIPSNHLLDSMAFDSARGKVTAWYRDRLFAWDGSNWADLGSSAPAIRRGTAMAFDVARSGVVLFGGDNFATQVFNDTWLWNGVQWELSVVAPVAPSARTGHDMVYDAKRGQIVLFGGGVGSPASASDTWLWSEEGWELAATGSNPPLPRAWHSMAYDTARDRVVMFGGGADLDPFGPGAVYSDTWEWNGELWSPGPVSGPPGRKVASLAFDAANANTVLFGGTDGRNLYGDTWTFDGASWVQKTTVTAPSARTGAALAYDPLRGRVVMFGGVTSLVFKISSDETWEWDGSTWTNLSPALSPAPRGLMSLVFDPDRGRIVLVSGRAGTGGGFEDVWEWDGTNWSQFVASGLAGQQRLFLTHHAIEHRLIAFGGPGSFSAPLGDTVALQYRTPLSSPERCLLADLDEDGDGLEGCDDPDCWPRCAPACPPGSTCPPTGPRCGDGTCSLVESITLCPADCN